MDCCVQLIRQGFFPPPLFSQENIIAVIGQKMLSIHDKYAIDIYRPEHEDTVIAILVTLQHMMKDRAASSAAAASGSHSTGK